MNYRELFAFHESTKQGMDAHYFCNENTYRARQQEKYNDDIKKGLRVGWHDHSTGEQCNPRCIMPQVTLEWYEAQQALLQADERYLVRAMNRAVAPDGLTTHMVLDDHRD